RIGNGSFPASIRISHRKAVWRRDSVLAWVAEAIGETKVNVEALSCAVPSPAPDPLGRIGVRLLSRREVRRYVGLSKREIYRLAAIGRFPTPVSVSDREDLWRSDELADWLLAAL